MLEFPLRVRITGVKEARNSITQLTREEVRRLREAAEARAQKTQGHLQTEMAREYRSAWATGRLAAGISFKTFETKDGIQVQFYIQNQRELQFVTAALGGHFRNFPVGPFVIRPTARQALSIPLPGNLARRFIRGKLGRFAGSRTGGIVVKSVIWGNRSGGFSRDVITEVAEQEGALFVDDVIRATGLAIQQATD